MARRDETRLAEKAGKVTQSFLDESGFDTICVQMSQAGSIQSNTVASVSIIKGGFMGKTINTGAALVVALGVLPGCAGVSTTIAPPTPARYEVLARAEGKACGSLGIFSTAYYFIPMVLNSRVERAYRRALASVPGATGLVNISFQEDWYWWVIGTARCVTISGDAIREVN